VIFRHVRGSPSNVPFFVFFQSVLSVSPFFNSNLCAQGYSDNVSSLDDILLGVLL
jgi:hypothetical protein